MAEETRSTIQGYFETGDVPTQTQFEDAFDSCIMPASDGLRGGGQDDLTAFAGGGQGSGTAINLHNNRFTTVATTGDSGTLLSAVAGAEIIVRNDGANAMDVFPASGEQINSLGVDTAYSLAAGSTLILYCFTAGVWLT